MSFRNRVHVLSDQLEGDAPIVWRRYWLSLLVLALITLFTGPWLVMALWVQRWNVRALWDAKDHWEGTRQFAITFVIIGILLVIAFIKFQPVLSVFGHRNIWSWVFYHTLFWWFCWGLLTPNFALLAERVDPRTQRIRRVLLTQERPAPQNSAASDQTVAQSRRKKATTPKKRRKGRPIAFGILLAEEKAEMERRRKQVNYIQLPLASDERTEATPDAEPSLTLLEDTASSPGSLKSKKQLERREPETLDNLF